MILSGKEIENRINEKTIVIEPFNSENLNPNSYNLTLDNHLLVYDCDILDSKRKDFPLRKIEIPKDGLLLQPNTLYLGKTVEYTETHGLVPMLEGRSSIGRLGLDIHVCAGFGDVGFCGNWTLELRCVMPIVIYPNMRICQIRYETIFGEFQNYNGKYQNERDIQASRFGFDS